MEAGPSRARRLGRLNKKAGPLSDRRVIVKGTGVCMDTFHDP